MRFMTIVPDARYTSQSINMDITVRDETKRVLLDMFYSAKTDKWYVSLTNMQTGEVYLTNVPILCSYGDTANNLWEPFWSKNVGMLVCFPKASSPSTVDPSVDNFDEFELVWSDGHAE